MPIKGDAEIAKELGDLTPMKGQDSVPPANKTYENAGENFKTLKTDGMIGMSCAWVMPMP